MKVYHERKSYATRTDEPPEKQAYGLGNGEWGLGNRDWGIGNGKWRMGQQENTSAGRGRGQPIIPIAPPESL